MTKKAKPMNTKQRAEMSALLAAFEANVKADAAKQRKPVSRNARLRAAEAEVEASAPKDARLVFDGMSADKSRAAKPAAKAKSRAAPVS